ncbi:MAG: metallophosphoesterase [Planctomycetaceae bacterium]|jgi:3',5'-cyclic AMP phosphodiesterase CpdA|nr:metallophosphoesterase [Planctomycetaceae bacterium]
MPTTFMPIKRRQFLAGTFAAGLFTVFSAQNVFAGIPKKDHWIFLSDTHVPGDPKKILYEYNPHNHFCQVRDEILQLTDKPQGIIVTGDFAFLQGQPEDYKNLKTLVTPYLDAEIPVHVSLGNHDHLNNLYGAFPDFQKEKPLVADENVAILETPNCNLFLLDSLYQTNVTPGFLGITQLRWLKKELTTRQNKPAILFAHHNLDNGPDTLMDREELWVIIKSQKQVKAYIYGHTHVYRQSIRDDVHLINLPALGWEFQKGKQPLGWTDAVLSGNGIELTLHTIDKTRSDNGHVRQFTWLR